MVGCRDGWMDEWVDMDGWMDGWIFSHRVGHYSPEIDIMKSSVRQILD